MSKRPWMPLYIGDYLGDTAHLSAAQSGAYLHLIMHYWAEGGLPDNDRALARIAKVSPRTWWRYRPILQKFFTKKWKHKRIESEINRANSVKSIENRSNSSKKTRKISLQKNRPFSLKSLKKKHREVGKMPTSQQKFTNDFNGPISHTHSHTDRKKEEDARAREEKYHGKQKTNGLQAAYERVKQSITDDEHTIAEAERRDQKSRANIVRMLPDRRRS